MKDRYRDPVHGFIEVSAEENRIINSVPFQRLRNIKQLAMTYMVFHGAEHTRFGHSLGVMHLVTLAFEKAVQNSEYKISVEKYEWYKQILRLIALTHDLGHAPFSHASEAVFPSGLEHEDFTEKIIRETCIAEHIKAIGREFKEKYNENYDITPDLIVDIYRGRLPGENSEFTFLRSFMDSELDCDKMDYLLRDSLYCGVNYGRYDLPRLLNSLTVYIQDAVMPRLAIHYGGVQAFEEFVLARYFMFTEVYFHRTRRYFDLMFADALHEVLPDGKYPDHVNEYLQWDDCRVWCLLKQGALRGSLACKNIVERLIYPCVAHSSVHGGIGEYRMLRQEIMNKFGKENFITDNSADKMPHKIPRMTEIDDENAIVIVDKAEGKLTTISEESPIMRALTEKIAIRRLYVVPKLRDQVSQYIKDTYRAVND